MVSPHLHPVPRDGSAKAPQGAVRFSSALTIRVELEGSTPPIWRRFQCPSDLRLDELHGVLQTVMGWTNSHLRQFTAVAVPGRPVVVVFDPADIYAEPDEGAVPEVEVRLDQMLQQVGETLEYVYDFGDYWEHTLTLEAITGRDPADRHAHCLAGERAVPPENVGGIGFYEDLMGALHGPAQWRDQDVTDILEVTGLARRADIFDLEKTNQALVREAGARAALDSFERHQLGNAAPVVLAGIMARLGADARMHVAGYLAGADLDAVPAPSVAVARHATRVIQGMLDQVGKDGVTLTAAGYLPPATVAEVMAIVDAEENWIGKPAGK